MTTTTSSPSQSTRQARIRIRIRACICQGKEQFAPTLPLRLYIEKGALLARLKPVSNLQPTRLTRRQLPVRSPRSLPNASKGIGRRRRKGAEKGYQNWRSSSRRIS